MSGANAIHGVVMLLAATANNTAGYLLVSFAAMNAVGGYMVTDRMLAMFHTRRESRS